MVLFNWLNSCWRGFLPWWSSGLRVHRVKQNDPNGPHCVLNATSVRWKLTDGQIFTWKITLYQNPIHTRPNKNRESMKVANYGRKFINFRPSKTGVPVNFFCPNICTNYFCSEIAACDGEIGKFDWVPLSTTAIALSSKCHQIVGAVWTRKTNCRFFWKRPHLYAKFLDGA